MDVSQGPGWWVASDGKWYPPEQHPDVVQWLAPTPAQQPTAQAWQPAAPSQQRPAQAWGPTQQASPPFTDPWQAQAQAQATVSPGAAIQQQARAEGWEWGPAPHTAVYGTPPQPPKSRKPLLIGAGVAVLVVVVGVALFLVLGGSSSNQTPQALAQAIVNDFKSSNIGGICDYAVPNTQDACRAGALLESSVRLSTVNAAVGSVSQQGTEALAVVTGTLCVTAGTTQQCETNTDPNVDLDKGQTFAAAYLAAMGPSSSSAPNFTLALVEQSGRWYVAVA